jgi:hypothetical protein
MVTNVGGAGAVQMMNIEGLDLESMLMAVQTNRVNLMDQQLKDQMEVVQGRNNRISELNTQMNGMNAAIAKLGTAADAKFPASDTVASIKAAGGSMIGFTTLTPDMLSRLDAGAAFMASAPMVVDSDLTTKRLGYVAGTDSLANHKGPLGNVEVRTLLETMKDTGYVASAEFLALPRGDGESRKTLTPEQDATLKAEAAKVSAYLQTPATVVDPKALACTDRASAEAYVKSISSEIDALGNSQQMDMLRLQSLSNKRNEAFEIMTNFMKKLAESRSGIIRNI